MDELTKKRTELFSEKLLQFARMNVEYGELDFSIHAVKASGGEDAELLERSERVMKSMAAELMVQYTELMSMFCPPSIPN